MLSEEMLIERAGNFTASQNHRLMAGWDKPEPSRAFGEFDILYNLLKGRDSKPLVSEVKEMTDEINVTGDLINKTWAVIQSEIPPTGLVAYAQEKAIEELFFVDPSLNFSTVHTRNGEERELYCMERLSEETGINFVNTGDDQIHVHDDGIGCTPDGIVLDDIDMIETGAEVKCKSPHEHAKLVMINTGEELKKSHFDHFVQVQTCLQVTGANHWHFACYNPYAKKEWLAFKNIIVHRDDAFIKILLSRIAIAKKIKADFLAELMKHSGVSPSEAPAERQSI